jgi:1,4-dihydroxy-2-naphthoate octaprenyltransferase
MNNLSHKQPRFLSLSQVALYLAATLFYLLGAGMAHFLGEPFRVDGFWSGLLFILLIFGSGFLLQSYFEPYKLEQSTRSETGLQRQRQVLLASFSLLAGAGMTAYMLFLSTSGGLEADLFIFFIFIAILLYAVPPIRLASRGYGELTLVLVAANIVTPLAYVIQSGALHNMLIMVSLPLTFFLFAMCISTGMIGYLNTMLSGEKNLIILLGWKLALDIHDWLIVGGYVLLGLAYFKGLAWSLVWPAFIALPVFLVTIYEIHRIKAGIKPRWAILTFSGYTGVGLLLYTLLFTLWFR